VKTTTRHTNFLSLLERAARLELAASALGLRRSVLLSYARDLGVTGENRTLVDWFTTSRLNHSATVTKKTYKLVDLRGIEPRFPACKAGCFPLAMRGPSFGAE
jgi:hypothetical protein